MSRGPAGSVAFAVRGAKRTRLVAALAVAGMPDRRRDWRDGVMALVSLVQS